MNQLVLHSQTNKQIRQLLLNPPHAIMLTGNEGSGKRFTAVTIAAEILGAPPHTHPYFIFIEPAGNSFTIDQIRELQKAMKLKTTGKNEIRRLALLQDIHLMTVEAQNALLKLLEEPPEDTVLILTARSNRSLKPTIYSRVQVIHIKNVSKEQLMQAQPTRSINEIEKLYALSGGNVGLFMALIENTVEHPLVRSIETAKSLLSSSTFERLARVEELSKDKDELKSLLGAMKRITIAALRSSASKNDSKGILRWSSLLDRVNNCEEMLISSVNPKLLLTELFMAT